MKVVETTVKEFKPYKVSIKTEGEKFVLEYWVRFNFLSLDGKNDYVAHEESFNTLQEALDKFNDVIKEIK